MVVIWLTSRRDFQKPTKYIHILRSLAITYDQLKLLNLNSVCSKNAVYHEDLLKNTKIFVFPIFSDQAI